MTSVDQQKIRRTRTGLIAHDPALAQPGYTLFTPMYGDGTVYLIDMAGEVAHTWKMPHRPGLYGYLFNVSSNENYALLSQAIDANGRTNKLNYDTIGGEVRLRGALLEIDESTGRAMRLTRVDEAGLSQTALPEPEPKIDIEPTPSPEET